MHRTFVDRITEAAAVLCLIAGFAVPALSVKVRGTEPVLASLAPRELSSEESARFTSVLGEARRLVDANGDAGLILDGLQAVYPGRHEVWALSARFEERSGHPAAAVAHYARAVRLDSGYIEEGSGVFLGRRIENLTDRVLSDLLEEKRRGGLDETGKNQLKASYFLKRRLAGGCE